MENSNVKDNDNNAAAAATCADAEQNPPNNGGDCAANRRRRTPFTDLSQVDADLALARTLQEQIYPEYLADTEPHEHLTSFEPIMPLHGQSNAINSRIVITILMDRVQEWFKKERAYLMLTMDAGDGSDYGSWEADSYGHEDEADYDDYDDASEEDCDASDVEVDDEAEDAFDVHAHAEGVENDNQISELDPSTFSNDEAYARALQDAEEREMAARLLALAGINEMVGGEDEEEHGGNSQDAWEEADPDELSYEELLALGDVVGTESRGLSADTIASLPSISYKSQGTGEGSSDSCVICRLDYEDGNTLTVLSCKHSYHSECINNWLQINKVCPVCSAEVSTT